MSDPMLIENTKWLCQGVGLQQEMLTSIAISLKRIADAMSALRAYDAAHPLACDVAEMRAALDAADKSAASLAGADPPSTQPWPDCMMPDGAEPCAGFRYLADQLARERAEVDRLMAAARQPRPITEAMIEAATIALCCGKECDAANACAGHGLSPGGYADRYGCGSTEKRNDAIAALEAAERARAQQS